MDVAANGYPGHETHTHTSQAFSHCWSTIAGLQSDMTGAEEVRYAKVERAMQANVRVAMKVHLQGRQAKVTLIVHTHKL